MVRILARVVAIVTLFVLLSPYSARAATFVVTTLDDSADPAADPLIAGSLRKAVADANATPGADTITFDPLLTGTIALQYGMLRVTESVTITGPGPAVLTISGSNLSTVFYFDDEVDDDFDTNPLNDVTQVHAVSNLRIADAWAWEAGGAIISIGEDLSLTNVVVENNQSGGFDDGMSPRDGGAGLWFLNGHLLVQDSIFRNNRADNASSCFGFGEPGGRGGAMFIRNPGYLPTGDVAVVLRNVLVENNSAKYDGGGVAMYLLESPAAVQIENSRFLNNTAGGCEAASGGGLFILAGNVFGDATMRDDVIWMKSNSVAGNSAVNGAGVFAGDYQMFIFDRSTASGNMATGDGGGLYVGGENSVTYLDNATVSGNTAQRGAIATGPFNGGTLGILSSTINANVGVISAGVHAALEAVVTISDSIVANSVDAVGAPISDLSKDGSSSISVGYSLIETAAAADYLDLGNNLSDDPMLGPLADNGGLTLTHLPSQTSPVYNAAGPSVINGFDQRGAPRIIDGRAEMGSVEVEPPPPNGTVRFSLDSYTVDENAGTLIVGVDRVDGSDGPISVDYATAAGTAGAGDFVSTSGTLSWTNGDASQKTFEITIVDDFVLEVPESLTVTLSNVTGGAIIATPSAPVTITDDEPFPELSIAGVTRAEGTGGTTNFDFEVTLSEASPFETTVMYVSEPVTASEGSFFTDPDYTPPPFASVLTFAPGDTTRTITISVLADAFFEADETFRVNLVAPSNATLATGQATGTIENDDPAPSIAIADFSQAEGNAPLGVFSIPVTMSAAANVPTSVNYAVTAGGSATEPDDFFTGSGTLVFNPGMTEGFITVVVNGDAVEEPAETFIITLSSPAGGATMGDGEATVTILDDDAVPGFTINDVTLTEGTGLTTDFTFTVSIDPPPPMGVYSVNWSVEDVTTSSDFEPAGSVLMFFPGSTSQTVTVQVYADDRDEDDETFRILLSSMSALPVRDGEGIGTILDDDDPPAIAVGDVTLAEGSSGLTAFTFDVSLTAASGKTITVDYATADGTAVAGSDYTATAGTLTFAPGESAKQITVDVTGETLDEDDETFTIAFSSPVNATLPTDLATGTITNDDPLPALAIVSNAAAEGDGGTVVMTTTVTLTPASGRNVGIDYATSDGTATAGSDYVSTLGSLVFAPGETSRQFSVPIIPDTTFELDETYTVTLSDPLNATLAPAAATFTIQNDDPEPSLSIAAASVVEGNSGTTALVFDVTLSAASSQPVSVDFGAFNATASAPSDFAPSSGTLTFPPGTTLQQITVDILGDSTHEADETFSVVLTNPANATIAIPTATGTILNDDAAPALAIASASANEGNAGSTILTFPVTLSAATERTVTVDFVTGGGSATAGSDYSIAAGTLTFAPGETAHDILVSVSGDTLHELDQTFTVILSSATNATLPPPATGTILNDDAAPAITITGITADEGNAGVTNFAFDVALDRTSEETVTFTYATTDGSANAPGDYAASTGIATIPGGSTSTQITVAVAGDTTHEASETFSMLLTAPTNATLAVGNAIATIGNDDMPPSVSISPVARAEGNTGSTDFVFDVSLSAASGLTATVNFVTATGSASAPEDFSALSGMLTFAPGVTLQQLIIPVVGDAIDELDETFSVTITDPVNATIGTATATGTILDDDAVPAISIGDVAIAEGNDAGTLTFTLTMSGASAQDVTVAYATTDAGATAGSDYSAISGVLTIPAGSLSAAIAVPIAGDALHELDESFNLTLSSPVGATLADAVALATLLNDDAMPSLSVVSTTVAEGDAGVTNATFTVVLSAPSGLTVSVQYGTSPGTATSTIDYLNQAGTVTFIPGVTTQQFTVPVNGDTLHEDDEIFFVRLATPSNATITAGEAPTGTILNDDAQPAISITDVSAPEGNLGTTPLTFDVHLSVPSALPVTVAYSTVAGTASADDDFVAASGTLIFAPGTVTEQLAIRVIGDRTLEPDEAFTVVLTSPANATLLDASGEGVIGDDDGTLPRLTIGNVTVRETTGTNSRAELTLTLSGPSMQIVTASWSTQEVTATAGVDYLAAEDRRVTFAPGETSRTIEVVIVGDTAVEPAESFIVQVSDVVNALLISPGEGTVTIEDDDAPSRRRAVRSGS